MKEAFANADIGLFGLLLFFGLFLVVIVWMLRPGAGKKFQQYGQIPLREDDHE